MYIILTISGGYYDSIEGIAILQENKNPMPRIFNEKYEAVNRAKEIKESGFEVPIFICSVLDLIFMYAGIPVNNVWQRELI
jgi:hypothetical protein